MCAWVAPRTWVVGEPLTAAELNEQLRDNMLQTGPAKVTTQGDVLYASGANALARLAISGNGGKYLRANAGATAIEYAAVDVSLQAALQARAAAQINTSTRGIAWWAFPVAPLTIANADALGMGWGAIIEAGAGIAPSSGSVIITTGTTSGTDAGIVGPANTGLVAGNFFAVMVSATSSTNRTLLLGFHGGPITAIGVDSTNFIGFRASGTGNWFAVTRASGTETTTDLSVTTTANVALYWTYDGTDVLFYKNGVLVATHSTNIPTAAALYPSCGVSTQTTASKGMTLTGEVIASIG